MNYKVYGQPNKIILHGGPGAPGTVSSLAENLDNCIELYNKARTIEGQIAEINDVVLKFNLKELVLIGHSWGAWLAYMYAAKYKTSKIALLSCGAFKDKYLQTMKNRRQEKLNKDEQIEVNNFFKAFEVHEKIDMTRFGELMSKMDSYSMVEYEDKPLEFDKLGHSMLMAELNILRKNGRLLEMGQLIQADIKVIHGKNDPHPIEGIIEPFDEIGISYDLHLFDQCGHTPWHEQYARKEFYELMKETYN